MEKKTRLYFWYKFKNVTYCLLLRKGILFFDAIKNQSVTSPFPVSLKQCSFVGISERMSRIGSQFQGLPTTNMQTILPLSNITSVEYL